MGQAASQSEVEAGQREFAARFSEEVFNKAEGNAFLSPLSVSIALTLAWAGAKGPTAEQMASTLHLPKSLAEGRSAAYHKAFSRFLKELEEKRGEVILQMANALWVDSSRQLLDSFIKQMKPYKAAIQNLDFTNEPAESAHTINSWIEEKTEKKITNLISSDALKNDTKMVITNAIYFNGLWEEPFQPGKTYDRGTFHLLDNSGDVRVPMMRLDKKEFFYKKQSDHEVIGLPYKGNQTAMFVLLPKQNSAEALGKLSSKEVLLDTMAQLPLIERTTIILNFPRFKTACTAPLKQTLIDMGMELPFSLDADFSGLSSEPDLQIAEVLHKAFVEVNEQGTEAAAATAVITEKKKCAPKFPVVNVNHPFVFVIAHIQSQTVLFAGRIVDPSQEGN